MTFVKGQKKPPNSGRKIGTQNIKYVKRVEQILTEMDINPFYEILKLLPSVSNIEQLKAWFNILSYIQGKPKDQNDIYHELINGKRSISPL